MRPSDLNPLFAEAQGLRGIGPKLVPLLDRLLGPPGRPARIVDLLFHLPVSAIDRRARPRIREAPRDAIATLEVRVVSHHPAGRGKAPYRVIVEDDTGDVTLVFFLNNPGWVEKALPIGATRWVSGKLEMWDGRLQMVHPDRVLDEAGLAGLPPVEPVYAMTEGLYPRVLAKAIDGALQRLPSLPEWLEPNMVALSGWPRFDEALRAIHRPATPGDIAPTSPAWGRLAYDELLAGQLALGLVRSRMRRKEGRPHRGDGRLAVRIEAALPFSLTAGQRTALAEIRADLSTPQRMLRLLQGDVGSGKTIVALLAAATVVETGAQAALMVPTEILARQHHARILPLAEAAGLRVAVLTGRDKASEKAATLAALESGEIDLVVGTHALFSEAVAFRDLGLVVVDEQHRFGVTQRLALTRKSRAADLLVMTATPIPRTLVLTLFGDLDVSVLREKPAGRKPIETLAKPVEQMGEVLGAIDRALAAGARIYWICPLVEESETVDLVAAQERHAALAAHFGTDKVGLVHGQMKGAERDAAMQAFADGTTPILVATTVIEVGVDVPEANIMVIEHAERFGLAQLHQLRGRVGRGQAKSVCLLLYKGPLGEAAKARIETMRRTEDGFVIAEEDLRLRGEGEVIGTRQSGLPVFRVARLEHHGTLLEEAREEAAGIVAQDPELTGPRGEGLRRLLYIFERDAAVRLLAGG